MKRNVGCMKKNKVFALGLCFNKLFYIFIIGSIIGSYYEQLLYLFQVYFSKGQIVWSLRRGVIYGPFNVIYGFGAVLMVYLLCRKEKKWYKTLIAAGLIGGSFEYLISFLQEIFIGCVSWDYSDKILNINGRTTVPIMIIWGIAGLFLVKILYPFISNMIEKIPYNIGNILTKIFAIFMIFNMTISWGALIRQTLRKNEIKPFTFVGEFFDNYYDDTFLKKYFPNMVRR